MDTSAAVAKAIHEGALRAVVDRIANAEREYHPTAVPIVAANVALAAGLESLISLPAGEWEPVMRALRDRSEGGGRLDLPVHAREPEELVELRHQLAEDIAGGAS